MKHTWKLFAVSSESRIVGVAICRVCGEGRYSTLDERGYERVRLGGDCTGDLDEPDHRALPPAPDVRGGASSLPDAE